MANKKPIIGIVVAAKRHTDKYLAVESKYMLALEESGAIPVLFPIYREGLMPQDKLLSIIDGILLTGSFILKDKYYNHKVLKRDTLLKDVNPVYYDYCVRLIKKLRLMKIPLLGVCRGMQIMAEENGARVGMPYGTKSVKHKQNAAPDIPSHPIKIQKNSLFGKLAGEDLMVNSFHRQHIIDHPKDYNEVAFAEDGCPEVIESKTDWFSVGMQFHPEWLYESKKGIRRIFRYFVGKAAERIKH